MKEFLTLFFIGCFFKVWTQAPVVDCPDLINLGPDITVCNNADFVLNPNPLPNAQYNWISSGNLSCNDCPSPNVSGLTTGIYFYIVIVTTPECVASDTLRVNVVNGQQPQYIIGSDQAICNGGTVSLGGESASGTFYNWTSVPAGLNSTIANPVVTPTQTTTYYLEAQNGSCPVSSFDSIKISVYTPPVLILPADTAICNGQSVVLGNTAVQSEVTYTWIPNGGTLSDSTTASPLATPIQTTLYTLIASNPGCIVTDAVLIAVVNLNFNLTVPDTLLLCKGNPLKIQALTNPVTNVSWSPLIDIQLANNGKDALLDPQETRLYTATASLPGCTRQEQLYVRVDSLPANLAIFPADTTVCIGSQVLLRSTSYEPSDFPDITFSWSPAVGQLTSDTLYNMVLSPIDTTVYQRIAQSGACLDTTYALVNVVQPPTLTINPPNSSICPGESVQLNSIIPNGVVDISWSPNNPSISCTDCPNPIVSPTTSTTYQLSGTFDGCPTGASAQVNVRIPPSVLIPTDLELCTGESLLLNQANDPSATYVWTATDPNFGTVTVAQPVVVPSLPVTTYTVVANNGCITTKTFTVNMQTATLMTAGADTICQGGSALISASTSLPGSFLWSNGETRQLFNVTPAQTTTYTVVYTYGNNCTLSDDVTITVQGQNAETAFPADLELCPGESIELNSLTVPGASYQWTSNPAGLTSTDPQPTVSPAAGTTTYYLKTNLGICEKTDSIKVIVYSANLTLPADSIVCGGTDLQLLASANATGNFLWTTGDTTAELELDSITKTGTYGVLFTYGSNNALCTLTESVTITVKPSFNLKIVADPNKNVYDLGENIDLTAIVSPTMSLNGFNFVWKQNNQILNGNGDMISVVTDVSVNDTAILTYSVMATSSNGCSRTVEKQLILLPPIVRVPNVFTPNGDGTNDIFKLKILSGIARIENMTVYNRWGQKVYESTDQQASWDGKIENMEAPSDVYVYRITWRDGSGALRKPEEGEVTLVR